jgi:VanZ like family
MSRRPAAIAMAAYITILAAVTLGASPGALFTAGASVVQRLDGLDWITSNDIERAANVLLFVPAGFLLCSVWPQTSRWLLWLSCVAASAAVEAVQFGLPGRNASPIDVVTNSTGAAIGVLIHAALTYAQSRSRS